MASEDNIHDHKNNTGVESVTLTARRVTLTGDTDGAHSCVRGLCRRHEHRALLQQLLYTDTHTHTHTRLRCRCYTMLYALHRPLVSAPVYPVFNTAGALLLLGTNQVSGCVRFASRCTLHVFPARNNGLVAFYFLSLSLALFLAGQLANLVRGGDG